MTITALLLSMLCSAAPTASAPPDEAEAPPTGREAPVADASSPESPQASPPTEPAPDNDPEVPAEPEPELAAEEPLDPEVPPEPSAEALDHLARAQTLKAAGSLDAAEAEVSVAISLQPTDGTAYLERAQIRMSMAEQLQGDDQWIRRQRATLLRQAAEDVGAYLDHTELSTDSVTWFQARQEALRREADALDPPAAEPEPAPAPRPEPEPEIPAVQPVTIPEAGDADHRKRSRALWSTGTVLSAGAVGLASASLAIKRQCEPNDGPCSVRWGINTPYFAPAAALTALGTTSIVLGLLDSPGLSRPRTRKVVTSTTLALGGTATALGAVTGVIAGALYRAPVQPSDLQGLSTNTTVANVSAASFAAAVPLLSAGLTAWLGARRSKRNPQMAWRR